MLVEGKNCTYEVVIGLEVHAQINSKKKLFSASPVVALAEQNTCVNPLDFGMPGTMPVLNFFCVEQAIKTGLAINGKINKKSRFDRKHYFYPDLPLGYQITQFYEPIVRDGHIEITLEDGSKKKIRINRIHIEQDAGKLIHDKDPKKSYLDLNRAGVGLMEIVTEPDLRSVHEVNEYVHNLRAILKEVETSDADMEKGNFRCDVNISIRPKGSDKFGTRCEIKNLNSFKAISKAIEYEVARHVEIIESGGVIKQQTRLFDQNQMVTKLLRDKEDSDDYRYFPDPDLMQVDITDELIFELSKTIPELPSQKAERYAKTYLINHKEAINLSYEKSLYRFFEEMVASGSDPKMCSNFLLSELLGRINKAGITLDECKVTPKDLASLVKLISNSTISGKIAKDVLDKMFETGENPDEIIEKQGLKQISNESEIVAIADAVIAENQDKLQEYKSGKVKLFGFFVGEAMKKSKGKANPAMLNEIFKNKLN